MNWKKIKTRKLCVNNENYLWKRGHYRLDSHEYSDRAEKVLIYLEDYYNSPLILLFKEDDNLRIINDLENKKWCLSSWLDNTGIIYLLKSNINEKPQGKNHIINLNKPSVIVAFIKYHLKSIWNPKEIKEPTIIEDALLLLGKMEFFKEKSNGEK